ncbi:MAG: hypothetical protein H7319_14025 [Spirosoma sp.]|nr:hypothetical protein [Spirosoma sp.]
MITCSTCYFVKRLPLLVALFLSANGFAQNLLGISTNKRGGTNRLYINPALAADSPDRFYVNVATGSLHLDNNYVRYQAPFSLLSYLTGSVPQQYKNADGSVRFTTEYTKENLDGRPKNGTLQGEVRGPSFLTRVGERSAVAVTTRFRAVGQLTDASQGLLSALRAGLDDGALYGIPSSNNQFSAGTNTFSELGLTYATTIWETDGRKLLLGVTGKAMLGYNAQFLLNRGLDFGIIVDPNNSNRALLEVNRLDATLSYTNFLQNRSLGLGTLVSPSAPGFGVGADVGFTYVSQYDQDSPALQLGLAVTDIGGLRYKGEQYTYADVREQPVVFNSADFAGKNGSLQTIQVIQDKFTTGRSPDKNSFRVGLPTSINLSLDYQLPGGAGINVTMLQDVRSGQAMATHQPSLVAVTPRYNKQWLSLALPIAYLNRGIVVGASVQLGPVWLGTDNLLGLIGNTGNGIRPRGLDVYGGIAFGIGRDRQ